MLDLALNYGAEYSSEDDGMHDGEILLSESEVKSSLAHLVQSSKRYLYSKGMSEEEIQEMLGEENADETVLVPFVMSLCDLEKQEYTFELSRSESNTFNLFATTAYAANNDWAKVGSCAMQALGLDVITEFAYAGKVLTKAAIKSIFKTAAKRILGPIGVAIALVEFGVCMWE